MMRVILVIILSSALALSGCTAKTVVADETPTKVDLRQVLASGEVKPVKGITPAGQPDAAALRVFAENGYAAVIDLRTADEDRGLDEPAVVEGLGMKYVAMPIGHDGITFEKAVALDKLLAEFDEPVLLHCGSSNRVGALLALRASLNGATDAEALEIGKRAGLSSLESSVRQTLGEK
jgi:uncharacterized protein (TIGR01244 family)